MARGFFAGVSAVALSVLLGACGSSGSSLPSSNPSARVIAERIATQMDITYVEGAPQSSAQSPIPTSRVTFDSSWGLGAIEVFPSSEESLVALHEAPMSRSTAGCPYPIVRANTALLCFFDPISNPVSRSQIRTLEASFKKAAQ
jgi:hypothetical protein